MSKPAVWFYVVAVLALLWNLLGCMAFVADLRLTPEDIAKLPEAQQVLYRARPVWAIAATGVAVIGGALGCLALILRKRWATGLLVASLLGVLAQDFGLFVLMDGVHIAGMVAVVLQTIVLLVAIALVALARSATARGWLS